MTLKPADYGSMTEEEKVLAANQRFYEALQGLDLEAMDRVWLHEDWVKCVHPGWELLEGWDEVRQSWERIFENTRFMRVVVSEVSVRIESRLALVTCLENITSAFESGFEQVTVQATSLFVLSGVEWLMVHHHSSAVPQQTPTTVH